MKKSIIVFSLLFLLLLVAVLVDRDYLDIFAAGTLPEQTATNASKAMMDYTWAEFEAMTPAEQMKFQNSFASIEEFDKWLQKAQFGEQKNPWDEAGAKQPSEYTWAEFEALSAAQQMAFQNSFESIEEFDKWLQKAQFGEQKNPWDEAGAKQPFEYTWTEFEALTPGQQIAFQNSFCSAEAFLEWLMANEPHGPN